MLWRTKRKSAPSSTPQGSRRASRAGRTPMRRNGRPFYDETLITRTRPLPGVSFFVLQGAEIPRRKHSFGGLSRTTGYGGRIRGTPRRKHGAEKRPEPSRKAREACAKGPRSLPQSPPFCRRERRNNWLSPRSSAAFTSRRSPASRMREATPRWSPQPHDCHTISCQ